MKFFAATLLAAAALGVSLQGKDNGPLGEDLRKELRAFVKKIATDADADGNGKVKTSDVRQALRDAGVEPPAVRKQIAEGFKAENDGVALPVDILMEEVLDGARNAIKNEGASRDDVRRALNLVIDDGAQF